MRIGGTAPASSAPLSSAKIAWLVALTYGPTGFAAATGDVSGAFALGHFVVVASVLAIVLGLGASAAALEALASRVADLAADNDALRTASRAQEHLIAKAADEHMAVVREIHHRVKNNLQIVCSLLDLQLKRLKSPEAQPALNATQARVRTLALFHRHLYEDQDFHTVGVRGFIAELCDHLVAAADLDVQSRVGLKIDVDDARVQADQAVGVGLIITEAVLNALHHAFPEEIWKDRRGVIAVSLKLDGETATLVIDDDGVGIPALAPAGKGVGKILIEGFAKQIGGEVEFSTIDGTGVTVRFALKAL
jgi:two-component sensor histidine kinase